MRPPVFCGPSLTYLSSRTESIKKDKSSFSMTNLPSSESNPPKNLRGMTWTPQINVVR